MANTYARYEGSTTQGNLMANVLAILAGILAIWAFLSLHWLTLKALIIELGVDAPLLIGIAGALPGQLLLTLWLVPVAGVAVAGASAYGLMSRNRATRAVGMLQVIASLGLLVPVIALVYTYINFLDSLKKLIPLPFPLPLEAVLYPSFGLYLTALSFVVCLAAGIYNLRSHHYL